MLMLRKENRQITLIDSFINCNRKASTAVVNFQIRNGRTIYQIFKLDCDEIKSDYSRCERTNLFANQFYFVCAPTVSFIKLTNCASK